MPPQAEAPPDEQQPDKCGPWAPSTTRAPALRIRSPGRCSRKPFPPGRRRERRSYGALREFSFLNLMARAHELRQPRAIPTPNSNPTPASPQIRTGVTGVWRLDTAIGAASRNPAPPPKNAARRSAIGSQRSLEPVATATPVPISPPMIAPANNPGLPAALPRIDPITAPSPARTHAAMNSGRGFKCVGPSRGCHERQQAEGGSPGSVACTRWQTPHR